jgi:hypothetical protein
MLQQQTTMGGGWSLLCCQTLKGSMANKNWVTFRLCSLPFLMMNAPWACSLDGWQRIVHFFGCWQSEVFFCSTTDYTVVHKRLLHQGHVGPMRDSFVCPGVYCNHLLDCAQVVNKAVQYCLAQFFNSCCLDSIHERTCLHYKYMRNQSFQVWYSRLTFSFLFWTPSVIPPKLLESQGFWLHVYSFIFATVSPTLRQIHAGTVLDCASWHLQST